MPTIGQENFRPDIEGLRGVAILLVVAYHAKAPGFSGGFIGVDVFFTLSGYLITGLLVKEHEKTGRISLPAFYARRARRLLPASSLALFVTAVAAFVVYAPLEQSHLAKAAVAAAFYASNIFFARRATAYFQAETGDDPLLHTWSLGVEEQFYFVWPLIVLSALGAKAGRRRLVFVMAGLSVLSFALCVWLTARRQPWAFFLSPPRAWEFAVGALAVILPRRGWAFGWLGLAGLLSAGALYGRDTPFPGWAALLPALSTVFVLWAGPDSSAGRFLSAPAIRFFGRLSYSWYLWHWPVLVLAGALWGEFSFTGRLGCVVFALGIAALSYVYVENPARHHPRLSASPSRALAMAACLTLAGAGVAWGWHRAAALAAQSPAQARFTHAEGDRPLIYTKGCVVDYFGGVKECVFGENNSGGTMILFGDSHAAHWFPAVLQAAESRNMRLVTLIKAACSPADVSYVYRLIGRRYTECEDWRARALRRIRELRPALIVAAGSHAYNVGGAAWAAGTQRTMQALSETGASVLYVRDTPRPGFKVPACLARAEWLLRRRAPSNCAFDLKAGLNEERARIEREAAGKFSGVNYVDLTDHICPSTTCATERDGVIIFSDNNHLTASFARSLAPLFTPPAPSTR